jgi:hypothetical protein
MDAAKVLSGDANGDTAARSFRRSWGVLEIVAWLPTTLHYPTRDWEDLLVTSILVA